jgi:8-amino-7-oxononanoate synthase
VIDFTSANYLDLRHARDDLRPWVRLTTGVPAVLGEPPLARAVAGALAATVGLPAGILATSTLHAFWDLFLVLDPARSAIHVDAGAYPIARWGAERARTRGAVLRAFPHQDQQALRDSLRARPAAGRRPIVLTDGLCPSCGRVAPVADYLEEMRHMDGLLVIDDTQGLGVLGSPAPGAPYGLGGGGVLRWTATPPDGVLVVASLGKALGVPVAVVAGGSAIVGRYAAGSETRVHCSPPSAAHVAAAAHALRANRERGDALRTRLAGLVRAFRRGVADRDVDLAPGLFPMQTIRRVRGASMTGLQQRLAAGGVRAVAHTACDGGTPALSFLFRATHTAVDVATAVDALRGSRP